MTYLQEDKKCPVLELVKETPKPRFIMIVGMPGSGKTTYSESLASDTTIHMSSDRIRKELYGDENCQQDNNKVFTLMQERTVELLNKGFNVIYDATNIYRKNRNKILKLIPEHVYKECIVVWASVDTCFSRDAVREKTVGPKVIDKMLRSFEAPFFDEGFDKITVHKTEELSTKQYLSQIFESLSIPHDNPYHTVDIDEHCRLCGENLIAMKAPDVVTMAGFFHDIGKAYTKSFTNRKGEPTDIAHYYGHQSTGAWMSYGIATGAVSTETLAWLISTHMAPFTNQKYYNSLGQEYKDWIDLLHKADKEAC